MTGVTAVYDRHSYNAEKRRALDAWDQYVEAINIYDINGNIVGVVVSQLDKLKVAKAIGSLSENVNFGIKASTVRDLCGTTHQAV